PLPPSLPDALPICARCSPAMQRRLEAVLADQQDYDFVVNGRFKGGHITRRYGDPASGVEAVQLETSQRVYMDEDSFEYLPHKAEAAQAVTRRLLQAALA